jgi:putative oxidoreductase
VNASSKTTYVIPSLGRVYENLGDFAWLLVRVTYGYFFIPHGLQKLFGWFGGGGIEGTTAIFAKGGLQPAMFWAYYFGVLETFGGALLVVGLLTRPIAALFVGFMAVAILATGKNFGYFWTNGGLEVPLLLTVLAISILIRGGGKHSLDRLLGKEF